MRTLSLSPGFNLFLSDKLSRTGPFSEFFSINRFVLIVSIEFGAFVPIPTRPFERIDKAVVVALIPVSAYTLSKG